MTTTAKVYRDGADLLVLFGGDVPAGFEGFGFANGRGVVVRAPLANPTQLRAAYDWLLDAGAEVTADRFLVAHLTK